MLFVHLACAVVMLQYTKMYFSYNISAKTCAQVWFYARVDIENSLYTAVVLHCTKKWYSCIISAKITYTGVGLRPCRRMSYTLSAASFSSEIRDSSLDDPTSFWEFPSHEWN